MGTKTIELEYTDEDVRIIYTPMEDTEWIDRELNKDDPYWKTASD